MSITTTQLTRTAGLAAVVAGLLFIAVQVNHPAITLDFVSTAEFAVRQGMKVGFTALALVGITGMYLSQVRRSGVLGLIGYVILAAGFLTMFAVEMTALVVLPAIVHTAPGYVGDVVAIATNGVPVGDVGLMKPVNLLAGIAYMAGGLVFGIALFRAGVLSRSASIMLAVATPLALAIPLLPWINQRLFAVPTGVALIALGVSLWRSQRTEAVPVATPDTLVAPAAVR